MDAETRKERIVEIMSEILRAISEKGPRSLEWMSSQYRKRNEEGLCQIAFSRLEAEKIIQKRPDGKWEIAE